MLSYFPRKTPNICKVKKKMSVYQYMNHTWITVFVLSLVSPALSQLTLGFLSCQFTICPAQHIHHPPPNPTFCDSIPNDKCSSICIQVNTIAMCFIKLHISSCCLTTFLYHSSDYLLPLVNCCLQKGSASHDFASLVLLPLALPVHPIVCSPRSSSGGTNLPVS